MNSNAKRNLLKKLIAIKEWKHPRYKTYDLFELRKICAIFDNSNKIDMKKHELDYIVSLLWKDSTAHVRKRIEAEEAKKNGNKKETDQG